MQEGQVTCHHRQNNLDLHVVLITYQVLESLYPISQIPSTLVKSEHMFNYIGTDVQKVSSI